MNMSGHKIITIGRQFGSGGREIGQKLAERLSIPLYDRRLVSMAAESLGVRKEDAERVDESSLNTFVANYTVSPGMYMEYISAGIVQFSPSMNRYTGQKRRSSAGWQRRGHASLWADARTISSRTGPSASMYLSVRIRMTERKGLPDFII